MDKVLRSRTIGGPADTEDHSDSESSKASSKIEHKAMTEALEEEERSGEFRVNESDGFMEPAVESGGDVDELRLLRKELAAQRREIQELRRTWHVRA